MRSKQRAVTAEEKMLWSKMSKIGCIACFLDGFHNSYVSIHHIDGRTKPDCHKKVLPLRAPHHQRDDTDPMKRDAVHPEKARFEAKYGSQYELQAQVMSMLGADHAVADWGNTRPRVVH
ncbi:hypothetical protein hmeg3_07660 [Herbaspirillum sp. meg3]|nr:hypothetical protein hmeg3_07660 [Herbaspirillum sp. meg3]